MAGSRKIRVYLNGEAVDLFIGMKVKHLLSHGQAHGVRKGELVVTDTEGNERGLEGSLSDGEHLSIKPAGKTA